MGSDLDFLEHITPLQVHVGTDFPLLGNPFLIPRASIQDPDQFMTLAVPQSAVDASLLGPDIDVTVHDNQVVTTTEASSLSRTRYEILDMHRIQRAQDVFLHEVQRTNTTSTDQGAGKTTVALLQTDPVDDVVRFRRVQALYWDRCAALRIEHVRPPRAFRQPNVWCRLDAGEWANFRVRGKHLRQLRFHKQLHDTGTKTQSNRRTFILKLRAYMQLGWEGVDRQDMEAFLLEAESLRGDVVVKLEASNLVKFMAKFDRLNDAVEMMAHTMALGVEKEAQYHETLAKALWQKVMAWRALHTNNLQVKKHSWVAFQKASAQAKRADIAYQESTSQTKDAMAFSERARTSLTEEQPWDPLENANNWTLLVSKRRANRDAADKAALLEVARMEWFHAEMNEASTRASTAQAKVIKEPTLIQGHMKVAATTTMHGNAASRKLLLMTECAHALISLVKLNAFSGEITLGRVEFFRVRETLSVKLVQSHWWQDLRQGRKRGAPFKLQHWLLCVRTNRYSDAVFQPILQHLVYLPDNANGPTLSFQVAKANAGKIVFRGVRFVRHYYLLVTMREDLWQHLTITGLSPNCSIRGEISLDPSGRRAMFGVPTQLDEYAFLRDMIAIEPTQVSTSVPFEHLVDPVAFEKAVVYTKESKAVHAKLEVFPRLGDVYLRLRAELFSEWEIRLQRDRCREMESEERDTRNAVAFGMKRCDLMKMLFWACLKNLTSHFRQMQATMQTWLREIQATQQRLRAKVDILNALHTRHLDKQRQYLASQLILSMDIEEVELDTPKQYRLTIDHHNLQWLHKFPYAPTCVYVEPITTLHKVPPERLLAKTTKVAMFARPVQVEFSLLIPPDISQPIEEVFAHEPIDLAELATLLGSPDLALVDALHGHMVVQSPQPTDTEANVRASGLTATFVCGQALYLCRSFPLVERLLQSSLNVGGPKKPRPGPKGAVWRSIASDRMRATREAKPSHTHLPLRGEEGYDGVNKSTAPTWPPSDQVQPAFVTRISKKELEYVGGVEDVSSLPTRVVDRFLQALEFSTMTWHALDTKRVLSTTMDVPLVDAGVFQSVAILYTYIYSITYICGIRLLGPVTLAVSMSVNDVLAPTSLVVTAKDPSQRFGTSEFSCIIPWEPLDKRPTHGRDWTSFASNCASTLMLLRCNGQVQLCSRLVIPSRATLDPSPTRNVAPFPANVLLYAALKTTNVPANIMSEHMGAARLNKHLRSSVADRMRKRFYRVRVANGKSALEWPHMAEEDAFSAEFRGVLTLPLKQLHKLCKAFDAGTRDTPNEADQRGAVLSALGRSSLRLDGEVDVTPWAGFHVFAEWYRVADIERCRRESPPTTTVAQVVEKSSA
ncbi:hypothetical protein DYB35_007488 [Aphanomyces astaci]|uniref:Uncharacterized protein n=1 Tax=Aphanomyces astaci TaxID=112090 RepID=A0A3R7ABI9_APHAT|nr:hypothetical protein DYB35_007488 [Aphanomyces astaci]